MSFEITLVFMLFALVLVGNSPGKIESNTLSNFTFMYPHDKVKLAIVNKFETTWISVFPSSIYNCPPL